MLEIEKELSFRKYLNEQFIIESLDTSHKIIKTVKGNPDLYYFKINENEFRVFIEKDIDNELNLHIGFEYNDPSKGYVMNNIYDILTATNVLGIFGTVYNILKTYKFNAVMFCSNESKKFRTYIRLMQRLVKELNIKNVSHNDVCIFAFDANHVPEFKCSYKCSKLKKEIK